MKKKLAGIIAALVAVTTVAACGKEAKPAQETEAPATEAEAAVEEPEEATVEEEPQPSEEVYASEIGWVVRYDPSMIEPKSVGDPEYEVDFVYTGESAGTNMLSIRWIEDKLPDEVMEEIKTQYTNCDVSGNYFPGTTDQWGYWITPEMEEEGSGLVENYIIGEYENGTLMFDYVIHQSGDDEIDIAVSDYLAMILDSIEYENFLPQSMYDDIPGVYVMESTEEIEGQETTTEYSLALATNHSGLLSVQDDVMVNWDDRMIKAEDGSFSYFYTLKDGKLTLDYDGMEMVFTRQGEADGVTAPYEAALEQYAEIIDALTEDDYISFADIGDAHDVLLIASKDQIFDNLGEGTAAVEAKIYGFDKDGNVKEYGSVASGGTANPLAVKDGWLYYGNHKTLNRVKVDEAASELVTEEDISFEEYDDVIVLNFSAAK